MATHIDVESLICLESHRDQVADPMIEARNIYCREKAR